MKRNFLDQFYTVDPKTGDYIIEISLISYEDVFNTWDSSDYNFRGLDSSLESFLEECSFDIDLYTKLTLRFHMQDQKKDLEREKIVSSGIQNHFHYRLHTTKRKMKQNRKKVLVYIIVSLVLTFFSFDLPAIMGEGIFQKLLIQGIQLGGWVFLWEAFTLLFLQGGATRKKLRENKRLMNTPIIFQYTK